jgi:hypothetical protein
MPAVVPAFVAAVVFAGLTCKRNVTPLRRRVWWVDEAAWWPTASIPVGQAPKQAEYMAVRLRSTEEIKSTGPERQL